MKRYLCWGFVYLCGMMLLCLNMMAQSFDNNWNIVIDDNFSDFLGWNTNTFTELSRYQGYQPVWECFMNEHYTGVTTDGRHQAYQTSHAFLDGNNKMTLKAELISNTAMVCDIDYSIPEGKNCTNSSHPNPPQDIFYFSGTIETTNMCWFGYYELKCKLPAHLGEKTSFWLFGTGPHSYEEIDIFEQSYIDSSNQLDKGFSCGIHYNPDSTSYQGAHNTVKLFYLIENGYPDLSQEHTYACEWLPDKVTWFFDGEVIFVCNDRDEIPQHPMRLKITHPVLHNAVSNNGPLWNGSDAVIISYVKYNQLEFDCDTDMTIRNVNDVNNYQPGVKHSVVIGSSGGLEIPANMNIAVRASESITIDNQLTIPSGAQVTMIVQGCPDLE